MRKPGPALTTTMFGYHVWDYNFDSVINIIVYTSTNFRKKIDTDRHPELIHTVEVYG